MIITETVFVEMLIALESSTPQEKERKREALLWRAAGESKAEALTETSATSAITS